MCATIDDEPRFRGMIAEWIAEGSVPSYPAFVGESVRKQKKRKRKFEKEAIECEELKEELGIKAGTVNNVLKITSSLDYTLV